MLSGLVECESLGSEAGLPGLQPSTPAQGPEPHMRSPRCGFSRLLFEGGNGTSLSGRCEG